MQAMDVVNKIGVEVARRIEGLSFGSVSVMVVVHGGRVTGIEYQVLEKIRIQEKGGNE